MLTRVMNDRRLASGGLLSATADGFPVAGRRSIELRPHEPGQAKRTATVALRYGEVEICRPENEDRSLPASVRCGWSRCVRSIRRRVSSRCIGGC